MKLIVAGFLLLTQTAVAFAPNNAAKSPYSQSIVSFDTDGRSYSL